MRYIILFGLLLTGCGDSSDEGDYQSDVPRETFDRAAFDARLLELEQLCINYALQYGSTEEAARLAWPELRMGAEIELEKCLSSPLAFPDRCDLWASDYVLNRLFLCS